LSNGDLELQEKIRKLAIKIIKCYRGKGPDNVKVKIEGQLITVEIKGIISNLSTILIEEGAEQTVKDYWKYLKPHLEKKFMDEVYEVIGRKFDYTWKIYDLESESRSIILMISRYMV
jgi:uncharacterized protein YbcI